MRCGLLIVAIPVLVLFLPNAVLAQTSDLPKFEIWPEGTEISQKESSIIRGEVCPNPVPDSENVERYTDNGELIYPSTVSVAYYGIKPDGTQVTLDQGARNPELCENRSGAGLDYPDAIGEWTVYATATWFSNGEMVRIKSNEVSVLVKPATFQTLEPELLTDKPGLYALLDWSPDGRYILGKTYSPFGSTLGLMDVDSLEVTRLSVEFDQLYDARFSPLGEMILILAGQSELGPVQIISYNLLDNSTTVVAEDESYNVGFSAAWLQNPDENRIIYGEEAASGDDFVYDIWSVRADGSDVTKMHSFALAKEEHMWILDSKENNILMKRAKPLGFPLTEAKISVFDANTKESLTVIETGGDGAGPQISRFSPAGDVVLFDNGPGYKTPGGPILVVSIDGTLRETLNTGQPDLGNDPMSYVVSPDGRFIVALMDRWSSSDDIITKTEFIHPMPELGPLAALTMAMGIVGTIAATTRLRQIHKS